MPFDPPIRQNETRLLPCDPAGVRSVLRFLARRAIPGIEIITSEICARPLHIAGSIVPVRAQAAGGGLALTAEGLTPADWSSLVELAGNVFDADAPGAALAGQWQTDPVLGPILRGGGQLRVPGCWDGFELVIRTILGQQISVAAASTMAGRLVARWGSRHPAGTVFPSPGILACAPLGEIGLTRARTATIHAAAAAWATGAVHLDRHQTLDELVRSWTALPGIGPWSAQYLALRSRFWPDAFPESDLILRRAVIPGETLTPHRLAALAEKWRPWRAYAALLLWQSYARNSENLSAPPPLLQ